MYIRVIRELREAAANKETNARGRAMIVFASAREIQWSWIARFHKKVRYTIALMLRNVSKIGGHSMRKWRLDESRRDK